MRVCVDLHSPVVNIALRPWFVHRGVEETRHSFKGLELITVRAHHPAAVVARVCHNNPQRRVVLGRQADIHTDVVANVELVQSSRAGNDRFQGSLEVEVGPPVLERRAVATREELRMPRVCIAGVRYDGETDVPVRAARIRRENRSDPHAWRAVGGACVLRLRRGAVPAVTAPGDYLMRICRHQNVAALICDEGAAGCAVHPSGTRFECTEEAALRIHRCVARIGVVREGRCAKPLRLTAARLDRRAVGGETNDVTFEAHALEQLLWRAGYRLVIKQ